jgi:hypothetical protein
MKIQVTDERVFPTLGILAAAGDEVDVPEDVPSASEEPTVVASRKKPATKELSDGPAPQ